MATEQDLPTLNDLIKQLDPEPSLRDFLLWAEGVGCYPITDGFERFLKYCESRKQS